MKTAFEKTLDVLEWPRVLSTLSEKSMSPMGRNLIEHFSPENWNVDQATDLSKAVIELAAFHQQQKQLPLTDLVDLTNVYKRMTRGGAIVVEEFAQVIRNQKGVLSLKATIASPQVIAVADVLSGLDPLKDWCDVHFPLVDQHGQIADSASTDLRALRLLAKDLKSKIDEKLKNFLKDPHFAEVLRDDYVTLRDGRYVIPIKQNFKGRMPGIIHDVSKTESTFYIEPEAIVELNNQLKVTEREIEIEIERILAEVVERSKDIIPFFENNQSLLAKADYLQSAAKMISGWDNFCIPEEASELEFNELAHPLLSLQTKVVKNSLAWKEALILSGPNTGGKTVLLKSVGMALLFARAGIPICAREAKLPRNLKKVFAEMGDDQNLFEKLSTFSAHVASLSRILVEANPGDLVLIDEIATGTAPEEGQALAKALVEFLLSKGVRVFVTTHYGALKIMALADERCRVASMSYDTQKRIPLYKVILDVPGDSSAFDAAARLGIPSQVLDRAKQLLGEDSKDLTKALKNLETSRKYFDERLGELNNEKKVVKDREKELQRLKELAEQRLKDLSREEASELLKNYRDLRESLAIRISALKDEGGESTQIFEELAQKSQELKAATKEDATIVIPKRGMDAKALKKGVVVEIAGLGLGVVDEDYDPPTSGKAQVAVKVGEIKTRVGFERIFEATQQEKTRFDQSRKSWLGVENRKTKAAQVSATKAQAGSSVCDVRGRSWEETLRKIDSHLNQLTAGDATSVTIIHGHGKEVLKERIRTYLQKERSELKFRTGAWPGEGGDGVTIVEESA